MLERGKKRELKKKKPRGNFCLMGPEFELTQGDSDREAWRAAIHGVTKLDMTERLNNNKFLFKMKKIWKWVVVMVTLILCVPGSCTVFSHSVMSSSL